MTAYFSGRGVVLQPRDIALFQSLYTHRYLSATHIQMLHFPRRTIRVVQARLCKLVHAGYLFRTRTVREDWGRPGGSPPMMYLYALAAPAADIVADALMCRRANIPHTPLQAAKGFATLQHHLVVTDFLVALSARLSGNTTATTEEPSRGVVLDSVEREHLLRHKLGAYAVHHEVTRPWLIPDGAFSLKLNGASTPTTFYIEVVRSLPVGGRRAFYDKLTRYITALRQGVLQRIWQHDQVAAVLIMTPNQVRATRLRAQAEGLPSCRSRFWFAPYLSADHNGQVGSAFTTQAMLDHIWTDGCGSARSIICP